jgi:hypothetical protein
MYEHFGKICLKLNAHGIFIVWNIFLPIKKYSIPFEDIGNFKIIEKSSAVSGHWHELVVETSDVLLPIIESNDCNFLCDLEQQLNNLLIILRSDRAESSNTLNNTIHENIILSISKNDFDKNCYSNTNIPTGTEWNFEQKKEQYIWYRNGNFDLYSFAINLLFGIWLLGGVLLLTRYFSYSAITITNIMLLFFLTFGLLFILGAFLMLISKFYHEKLIYNGDIIHNRKTLFNIGSNKTLQFQSINLLVIMPSPSSYSVFFAKNFILPLFCPITSWQIQIFDVNGNIKLTLTALNKVEAYWIASVLVH